MSNATSIVKTLLLVFVAAIVGLVITNGTDILDVNSWTEAKPYISAGLAAVITFVYNYLSPYDHRYGVGSE